MERDYDVLCHGALVLNQACPHRRAYVCMHAWMDGGMCVYVCMYVRMHVCMHVCMYTYVHRCVPADYDYRDRSLSNPKP